MQNPYNCILGLDCGATHTDGFIFNDQGQVLGSVRGKGANLVVNQRQATTNLREVTRKLLARIPAQFHCRLIVYGIAGINVNGVPKNFAADLGITNYRHHFISDAQLACLSELQGENGVLAIAGTGSVVMAQNHGQYYRVGGWGHLLGDEGSGFHIGKLAILRLTYEYDHGLTSDFAKAVYQALGANTIFEAVRCFYNVQKSDVAKLSQVVFALAQKNDIVALQLLKMAAKDLAQQINLAITKAKLPDPVPLVLSGSPVEKYPLYVDILMDYLKADHQITLQSKVNLNNAKGAYYYAQTYDKDGA
ncbi:MAG: hypothetical protein LKF36_03930 [Lactobacillus sp.]|nr:hypothetical protein [Lactobacillus sp.]